MKNSIVFDVTAYSFFSRTRYIYIPTDIVSTDGCEDEKMVHRRHQYWSKYFCDRKEETRQLLQLLENGNNVSLIAPRRIGKTELIENLKVMQKFTGILNSLRSGISFDAMGNSSWNLWLVRK